MKEEWKLSTYPELMPDTYYVSNLGRVKTLDKLLHPSLHHSGYMHMNLKSKTGKWKYFVVHRLVAWEFVSGRTDERCYVNHIDADKSNNNATNLEWVTPRENIMHAEQMGLRPHFYGENNKSSRWKESDIRRVCEVLVKNKGMINDTISDLAKEGIIINKHKLDKIKSKEIWWTISDEYFSYGYLLVNKKLDESIVRLICITLLEFDGDIVKTYDKVRTVDDSVNLKQIRMIKFKYSWSEISDEYFEPDRFPHAFKLLTDDDVEAICQSLVKNRGNINKVYVELTDKIDGLTKRKIAHIKYKDMHVSISDKYFKKNEFFRMK